MQSITVERLIMSKNLEILNNDDVISVTENGKGRFVSGNTLKVQQLYEEYQKYVEESSASVSNKEIFKQYIECEVLRQISKHQSWRKGKIKLVVQFEADDIEGNASSNSLDSIRKQIDTAN